MTVLWKLIGGISFFLIGMNFLEESLQNLAGRSFKLFFKKHTSSNFKSIVGGVLSATILQSSSLVNLMAMAFAGANIIKIQYALAIIIGANLGTTLSSWIIALLGFSFHIESVALCFIGLFGIGMVLSKKETNWYYWNKFLFAFGLLFFGLSYITAGMNVYVVNVNLLGFNHLSAAWLLLLGFIFTALIQSSTATIALLLSA
ncbi:MAG: Na/Pi cotransporter family protein, partial [Ferruginibacter sp.]|nr:Na/Pi cotransporter family protein [Ferruginibacter sp.]